MHQKNRRCNCSKGDPRKLAERDACCTFCLQKNVQSQKCFFFFCHFTFGVVICVGLAHKSWVMYTFGFWNVKKKS